MTWRRDWGNDVKEDHDLELTAFHVQLTSGSGDRFAPGLVLPEGPPLIHGYGRSGSVAWAAVGRARATTTRQRRTSPTTHTLAIGTSNLQTCCLALSLSSLLLSCHCHVMSYRSMQVHIISIYLSYHIITDAHPQLASLFDESEGCVCRLDPEEVFYSSMTTTIKLESRLFRNCQTKQASNQPARKPAFSSQRHWTDCTTDLRADAESDWSTRAPLYLATASSIELNSVLVTASAESAPSSPSRPTMKFADRVAWPLG